MRTKLAIVAALVLGAMLIIAIFLRDERAAGRGGPAPALPRAAPAEIAAAGSADATPESASEPDAPVSAPPAAETEVPAAHPWLAIRAVDEAGAPVGGVRGVLNYLSPHSDEPVRKFSTDDEGLAALRLPPGRVYIDVEHPDYASVPRQEFGIALGERRELDLVMPEPRWLTGTVRDAETLAAIPSAVVSVDGGEEEPAIADGRGVYRTPHFGRIGKNMLRARADGYISETMAIPPEGSEPIDFELDRGEVIVGRIVDRDGSSVAGASIEVTCVRSDTAAERFGRSAGESESDGRFRTDGIALDGRCRITVRARGHGPVRLELDGALRGASGVIDLGAIVLPLGRTIEGEVLDASGARLVGRSVSLRSVDLDENWKNSIDLAGTSFGISCQNDGRFRFADLAPGAYQLSLDERGRPQCTKHIHIRDGDPESLWIVLVEEAGTPFRIEVVDESGEPVDQVTVVVDHESDLTVRAALVTDLFGITEFEGFAAPVRVHVRSPWGYAPIEPFRLLPAGQTERVVLFPGAVVRGAVLVPDGVPPGGLRLDLSYRAPGEGERSTHLRTADDGTFETVLLAGSVVDIECHGSRVGLDVEGLHVETAILWRGALRRVAAPAIDLVLSLERVVADRALSIRVADPGGVPLPGVFVRAWLVDSNARAASVRTGDDGVARLRGLPAQPVRIICKPPAEPPAAGGDAWLPPPPVSVIAEGQEIAIELLAGWRFRGLVLDADGTSPGGAQTRVETSTGRCDNFPVFDGSFEFVLLDGETASVEVEIVRGAGRLVARETGIAAGERERVFHLRPE